MKDRGKCRRVARDEEAGLLFRWRAGRSSARRTLVAVFLALVISGVTAVLIRVEGSPQQPDRRGAGRVTVLTPGSEASRRWLEWARQKAPYLDRWEPSVDGMLQMRMQRFESTLRAQVKHEPLLYPVFEQPPVRSELPPILDPSRPRLPPVKKKMQRMEIPAEVEPHVFTEASLSLRQRWGDPPPGSPVRALLGNEKEDPGALRPREFLGLERRFRVGVNGRGVIETCQPLGAGDSVPDAVISRWLRSQRMKAGEEPLVWGEIRVRVRGLAAGQESSFEKADD